MFEHEGIDKYSLDEIPINQHCYFMSEIYMEDFSNALIEMLGEEDGDPYGVGHGSDVMVRKINEYSIDLSWYPNRQTRFHEVSISLPKNMFKVCVGCWRYDVKPYIFIDHYWLEKLFVREYSVFALIDAIGVKKAIRDNLLTKDKLLELRGNIDELASHNKDILFISLADNIILKSNWSIGYFPKEIDCTYEPESFLRIIKEIQSIYRDVLSLDIYAVLTQGSNEYYEEPVHHISKSQNHICLNSLGVPFAELFAIDNAVKVALDKKMHPPSELYMDEQYYHSLNFDVGFDKNEKPSNTYKAIMKTKEPRYYFASCNDLLNNLKQLALKH